MIATFFGTIWEAIISTLAEYLPVSSGIPSNVETAVSTFFGYVNGLNLILPISELITILTLDIIWEGSIIIFHFIRFLINLIRGSGA